MINNFLHKTFAIVFSFLIVFSGVAFTVNKHICTEDIIVKSDETTPSCCESEEENSCETSHNEKSCCEETTSEKIVKSDDCGNNSHCNSECCINTNLRVQITTTDKVVTQNKTLEKKLPVLQQIHSYMLSWFYSEIKKEKFTSYYSPPTYLNKNLNILYQVFRI